MNLAKCNDEQANLISRFETKFGVLAMAYDSAPALANLAVEELEQLQEVEAATGLSLVIYRQR